MLSIVANRKSDHFSKSHGRLSEYKIKCNFRKKLILQTAFFLLLIFFDVYPSLCQTDGFSGTKFSAENGWLDPETRRQLQYVNIAVSGLLLILAGICFSLWLRLRKGMSRLKSVNHELLNQNELLQLATEATSVGIWDFYPAKGSGFISRQWFTMFGYNPSETPVPLEEWRTYVHPDDLRDSEKAFMDYIDSKGRGQYEAEMRIRRADGSWCWVLAKGKTVSWDEHGNPLRITGLHVNIDRIKQIQEDLARSEARFRAIFENAPIPLINISMDGKIVEVNNRLPQILGYTAREIPDIESWWKIVYPDPEYREQAITTWQKAVDRAVADSTEIEQGEYRLTCKDGTVRTMIIGGNIIAGGILASFFDITARKQAEDEREKLQAQLLQAQKLEAVGVLAGGLAHDFNNMLGIITGYSELLMMKMKPKNPSRESLTKILDAARSSAGLVRQLLTFARKQAVSLAVFDLNESVESMLKMLGRLISENIVIEWLPGKRPAVVRMDESQLQQILANLCVNARDAISDVGRIIIQTSRILMDKYYSEIHPEVKEGEYVLLAVSDTGCGMSRETMDRIFEPFFTTKGVGRGTGLGLATVYGIVKQNGGFVDVYSEPGKGTTFKIYIPFYQDGNAEKTAADSGKIPRGRGETILVIEDNPTLLQMTVTMLEDLGYRVISSGKASEIIRLAAETASEIHLLVTDVIMPEMNGRELADSISSIRPGIKHLYISGYTADVIVHHGVLDEGIYFLQKPFSLKDLAVKIRKILD